VHQKDKHRQAPTKIPGPQEEKEIPTISVFSFLFSQGTDHKVGTKGEGSILKVGIGEKENSRNISLTFRQDLSKKLVGGGGIRKKNPLREQGFSDQGEKGCYWVSGRIAFGRKRTGYRTKNEGGGKDRGRYVEMEKKKREPRSTAENRILTPTGKKRRNGTSA